jgi:hypothetical protein
MPLLASLQRRNVMITKTTLAFIATIAAGCIASSAFAQSHRHRDETGAGRHVARQHEYPAASRQGRNAFGMGAGSNFQLDPNSPAATGGGSLGYNQKLLQY